MELQTKYHGKVTVMTKDIITFEHGIPGFVDEGEFVLLPMDSESPFYIMQSTKTTELGFVVVNPFLFFKEYEFTIVDQDKELLEIEKEEDVNVLSILTIKEPFNESTANLKAPIIINTKVRKAKQIILNDPALATRQKIMSETITK